MGNRLLGITMFEGRPTRWRDWPSAGMTLYSPDADGLGGQRAARGTRRAGLPRAPPTWGRQGRWTSLFETLFDCTADQLYNATELPRSAAVAESWPEPYAADLS